MNVLHPTASIGVSLGMAAIALGVAAAISIAIHRVRPQWTARAAFGIGAWLAATFAIAGAGILHNFDARPPPMAIMFVVVFAVGASVGLSRVGAALADLPLWVLVIAHAFRLPLELVMHAATREGTMPNVMTWTGLNYDVVTGAAALVVGLALRAGASRILAWIWFGLSSVTLIAIVVIAFLASPMQMRFGPSEVNTWVTYPPFVWLPCVLVVAAIAGQIVIVRAMLKSKRQLLEKMTTPAHP